MLFRSDRQTDWQMGMEDLFPLLPRIEAELEQKRLAEREELMRELQEMKEKAQDEMDQQREDYEIRLRELEMEMVRESEPLPSPSPASHSFSLLSCSLTFFPLLLYPPSFSHSSHPSPLPPPCYSPTSNMLLLLLLLLLTHPLSFPSRKARVRS